MNKKQLFLLGSIVIVATAVLLAAFLYSSPSPAPTPSSDTTQEEKPALITYYACSGDLYYLVLKEEQQIRISNQPYARIPDPTRERYGNGEGMEFEIHPGTLTVLNTTDGTPAIECTAQIPEVNFVNTN